VLLFHRGSLLQNGLTIAFARITQNDVNPGLKINGIMIFIFVHMIVEGEFAHKPVSSHMLRLRTHCIAASTGFTISKAYMSLQPTLGSCSDIIL